MKDILERADIEFLVNAFYERVKDDEAIGYIFTDIAKVNWADHLPKMYKFWETVLLGKMSYKGNPMITHMELSKKTKINQVHFDSWLRIWGETIDDNFKGEIATEAKLRGKNIAGLMLYKIDHMS